MIPFDSEGYQWLGILDTYKRLEKLRSSYVDNLPDYVAPDDRVHPDFKVHGTEIGRLSASDPAVQTIPRPGTGEVDGVRWGKAVRDLFTVPEDWRWVKIDYSQAELRVAAALSGDEFLMEVYTEGRDLHSEVAKAMYGDDFSKEERQLCKNFNFSYLYGGTEHSFANEVGLDMATARQFVRRYNKVMKGLSQWKKEQFERLRSQGYVSTPTGRRRRFPMVTRNNSDDARKASVHAVVSGSASDLNLISMIRIAAMDLEGVKILLTVHDEIDFAIREDRLEEVIPILIETMEQVGSKVFPQLPWKADAEVGPAWGSIKKWKP
jgi:DNA polymerase-1